MKLFYLPNLKSEAITETSPIEITGIKNPRLSINLADKAAYNEWCGNVATKGYFLSPYEGLNPSLRITKNNPARWMHGIIADYDSPKAWENAEGLEDSTKFLPTWVYRTFSPGKCRLVWEFEKPINVYNQDVADEFIKELCERVGIADALPGIDKASFKSTQYFEMGEDWSQFPPTSFKHGTMFLPDSLLQLCMVNAAERAQVKVTDMPEIPIDKVAEEVERQFPSRCKNPFEVGKKQCLFWIEDGIEREGAVIHKDGMICYSDRAGVNFASWRTILGAPFVAEYEQQSTGRAASMFYFDGRHYWTKHGGNGWVYLAKEDAKMHLKGAGVNDRPPRGQLVSEVERVLIHVQTSRRVSAAVPVLFTHSETVDIHGETYLNISTKKAMAPAETGNPDDFPWLYEFMHNVFDGDQDGISAHEYFLCWFRRFYESALRGQPLPGQVVIIAGEAHTGKTFLNKCIIGEALSGSVDAEDLLMGETNFNKAGGENALWRCDDAASEGDWKTRQQFTKALKQMAANPSQLYQPKFRDAIELPFVGRVVVTCNMDPESLKILPALDGTIKDKVMLFKLRSGYRPHFFNSNYENEARIRKELPFFLNWLINRPCPPNIMDPIFKRFGVKSFHHTELVHQAQSETREAIFIEMLQTWMETKKSEGIKEIEITCTELVTQMAAALGGSSNMSSFKVENIGKSLSKILDQKMLPELTGKRPKHKVTHYRFVFANGVSPIEEPF